MKQFIVERKREREREQNHRQNCYPANEVKSESIVINVAIENNRTKASIIPAEINGVNNTLNNHWSFTIPIVFEAK